ncbi:thiamine pyrophosphate-dependent enzyme, partial [Pseudomonas sp. AB12(2023)]
SYREHVVGMIRGLDLVDILRMLRGVTLGGWTPEDHGNFHLYTLVLASQTLHATGYAMGMQLDGTTATGNPETDEAVIVYYGDGASSQG